MTAFAVVVNALATALNVALYVGSGSLISLGAAVFCGAMLLWSIAMATSR